MSLLPDHPVTYAEVVGLVRQRIARDPVLISSGRYLGDQLRMRWLDGDVLWIRRVADPLAEGSEYPDLLDLIVVTPQGRARDCAGLVP